MKKTIALLSFLMLIFVYSCDEEDNTVSDGKYLEILTDEGAKFTFKEGDESGTISSEDIIEDKWGLVQLGGGNFAKYLTINTDKGDLRLWFSFPRSNVNDWYDIIQGSDQLYGAKYDVVNPGANVESVIPELYFLSTSDYGEVDFEGNVTVERDKAIEGETYSLVGEITVYDGDFEMSGRFWDKDFIW